MLLLLWMALNSSCSLFLFLWYVYAFWNNLFFLAPFLVCVCVCVLKFNFGFNSFGSILFASSPVASPIVPSYKIIHVFFSLVCPHLPIFVVFFFNESFVCVVFNFTFCYCHVNAISENIHLLLQCWFCLSRCAFLCCPGWCSELYALNDIILSTVTQSLKHCLYFNFRTIFCDGGEDRNISCILKWIAQ